MIPELFIFDMIGTTVQPSDAIPEAFRSAFSDLGIELSDEQIAAIRGKSKREAISELLTNALGAEKSRSRCGQVYDVFQTHLREHYSSGGAQAIAGAAEAFSWCKTVDSKVALTTGFDRSIVDLLLSSLGWEQVVNTVVCNDDVPEGRPAPFLIQRAMETTGVNIADRVASVGDTVSDLQAGVNGGVGWNFAVLTGAHDRTRLSQVDGAIILDSVAELPEHRW